MESALLLVIGIAVLLVIIIAFIVVNESNKRSSENALRNTADKYIREQNARNETLARELNLDPDEIRAWIEEAYAAECIVPPPCPGLTTVNAETGCCDLTDEEISKFQKAMKVTQSILYSVALSYGFTQVVSGAYKASKAGVQVTRSAVQNLSRRMGRVASRGAAKVATRTSIRFGLRFLTKAGARLGMGPLGMAVLVMEVISFGLDMADPFGFNKYRANKVSQNMRNAYDVEVQKSTSQGAIDERTDYPLIFPIALAYPQHNDEFFSAYIGRFTGDAMELLSEAQLVNVVVSQLLGENATQVLTDEQIEDAADAFAEAFEMVEAVKRVERDDFIYSFYKDKGLESKIERVPFMSTAKRYGVSLSKEGCDEYNKNKEKDHIKYGSIERYGEYCPLRETESECTGQNPPSGSQVSVGNVLESINCKWDKNDGEDGACILRSAELYPEGGYNPLVALYTDTYRVLDPTNPGEKSAPNVIEKKLPKKCALAAPLGAVVEHCNTLHKSYKGVTFNYETGYCDYSSDFCQAYGMKYRDNDCEDYSGVDFSETLLGTTVTRYSIVVGNKAAGIFRDVGEVFGF